MTFCFFSVSVIHKGELRWNISHKPQNQDKVTELNTGGAEGNLDPSLQFCYSLPWIWVPACACGHCRCKAVLRQGLWMSTEGIWTWVINEHRPEDVSPAGPCVSSTLQVDLLAWVNCRQCDLFTVPGCSVLSWKNGHLNLRQLKWELSPMVQQWQASKCKTPKLF